MFLYSIVNNKIVSYEIKINSNRLEQVKYFKYLEGNINEAGTKKYKRMGKVDKVSSTLKHQIPYEKRKAPAHYNCSDGE